MIDITPKINEAGTLDRKWAREDVRLVLSELANMFDEGVVDWDQGDEEWGRIVSHRKATAYVSARLPIAFIQKDGSDQDRSIASRLGIIVISVPDFEAPLVRVAPASLSPLTQRPLTENVSYEIISVNDI